MEKLIFNGQEIQVSNINLALGPQDWPAASQPVDTPVFMRFTFAGELTPAGRQFFLDMYIQAMRELALLN
jgi:hypothetical protein